MKRNSDVQKDIPGRGTRARRDAPRQGVQLAESHPPLVAPTIRLRLSELLHAPPSHTSARSSSRSLSQRLRSSVLAQRTIRGAGAAHPAGPWLRSHHPIRPQAPACPSRRGPPLGSHRCPPSMSTWLESVRVVLQGGIAVLQLVTLLQQLAVRAKLSPLRAPTQAQKARYLCCVHCAVLYKL